MKVLIIGAHGKIGKMISGKMSKQENLEPTAFIRDEKQEAFFEELGVPTVLASLEDSVEDLTDVVKGFDVVVFTAGSGGKTGADKTMEIDLDGAVKTMIATENTGVKRFVIVSAAYADDRDFWNKLGLKTYYIAKHFADYYLKNSKLEYTIVRPVTLTDEKGTGTITVAKNDTELNKNISREDVATAILDVVANKKAIHQVLTISSGTTPIEKAITK